MEFSFSYDLVLLSQRGVAETKLALSVQPHVTRIRTDPNNGHLVIEFQTEPLLAGRYLEGGNRLLSPPHHHFVAGQWLGLDLELMWSQIYPKGATFQKWRAVSNYTLQDYTGNYTLMLAPCPASSDSQQLANKQIWAADDQLKRRLPSGRAVQRHSAHPLPTAIPAGTRPLFPRVSVCGRLHIKYLFIFTKQIVGGQQLNI
jgi:hypothetical protein